MEQWSDAQLLHDLAYPADSIEIVYERYSASVMSYAVSLRLPAHGAAELHAETWAAVLRSRTCT